MNQLINIKPANVYWMPYVITDTQVRIFFCNAIIFNNKGTGNVFINDIYLLEPGDTISFSCDQNEIDNTMYKMSFASGASSNRLQVFTKQNAGVSVAIQNMLTRLSPPPPRRQQIKDYVLRRGRGDF